MPLSPDIADLMPVSAIAVSARHRRDMGDLDGLARNIEEVGLLHPIVITPGRTLVAGARRIKAFERLGRAAIPATEIDLDRIVRGEYAGTLF